MKALSFNTFLCSRPCFPIEIIGIKAVLVACLYVFPNSELVHSDKKREQDTKTALRQNISQSIQGIIQKSHFVSL